MNDKKTTRFLLARHGETEWNCLRRLQGNLDSPLTKSGVFQSRSLADSVMNYSVDFVASSPLGRALNTAKACQQKLSLDIKINKDLTERNFGDWQGEFFDDLTGEALFEKVFFQVTNAAPPNGESGTDCGQRMTRALISIANPHKEQTILVITHGDAIRCFLSTLSRKSSCDAYSQYGNGKVFPVEFCHKSQTFAVEIKQGN